jgi:argininosuccinate lyase
VGKVVSYALSRAISLRQLGLSEYQSFSPLFGEDVYSITIESSVADRDIPGGTAPRQVEEALLEARRRLKRESAA